MMLPCVGLGTYRMQKQECYAACLHALRLGYRHIDTATVYCNEEAVGRAVRDYVGSCSSVGDADHAELSMNDKKLPDSFSCSSSASSSSDCVLGAVTPARTRQEIFITSKLQPRDMKTVESAYNAVLKSIRLMQLDYIDLYLLHWPGSGGVNVASPLNAERRIAAWRGLEKAQKEGKVRFIGVSNFLPQHLEPLLAVAQVAPAVNQVEFHPFLFQKELLAFCRQKGLQLQAYSSLAQGHPSLLQHPTVMRVAAAHGKTVAQVLLKWALQHGVAVIPKSVTPARIAENFVVLFDSEFILTHEQMAELDALHCDKRFCWDPTTVL